jgi:hypothetical protein
LDFDNSHSFTWSAWFKTSSATAQRIIGKKGRNLASYPGYAMDTNSSGAVQCWMADGTVQSAVPQSAGGFADGNWHLGTCVYNGTTKQLHLYVDGVRNDLFPDNNDTSGMTDRLIHQTHFRLGYIPPTMGLTSMEV